MNSIKGGIGIPSFCVSIEAYIMPPIMLGSITGAGATGSGLLATTASVVKIKLATDAAFCRAERLTLTGR